MTDDPTSAAPLILGIGAAAGGQEAVHALLNTLRADEDFALILLHPDPDDECLMPDLLATRSPLPVMPITDGIQVLPGHVYRAPPGHALGIEGLTLRLTPVSEPRGQIDSFLKALAAAHGVNAAALILSGTGTDGCDGIRAIKESGGLVFAQDPQEARHGGMPRAAIATGAVDVVLPAADMAGVMRDCHNRARRIAPAIAHDSDLVAKVVRNLRYHTGHDFSGYRNGPLLRRIALRMAVLGLDQSSDYLRDLVQSRAEAERLFRALLINATGFFRDADDFQALRTSAIRDLLDGMGDRDGPGERNELRIWVPGCSTGQEAYSIAMILSDAMAGMDACPQVVIFATDIDEQALAVARQGHYPAAAVAELPDGYLDRFFTASRNGHDLRPELRDMLRFSAHSLIKDPPFSGLDLIVCRNLLTCFDQPLQDLAMRLFHHALRPGGYLMLGPSEDFRADDVSFMPVLSESRIFRRDDVPAFSADLPRRFRPLPRAVAPRHDDPAGEVLGLPLAVAEALLARHVPPFVVLDSDNHVLRTGGGAEAFLKVAAGRASLDVLSLILPSLEPAFRRLLTGLALADGRFRQIDLTDPGAGLPPRLTIAAQVLANGERLVTFAATDAPSRETGDRTTRIVIDDIYVNQLEEDLALARSSLLATTEALETVNADLKNANADLMSVNENLRSTNEALSATTGELQTKLHELAEANADLANFMESTQIATVFLDDALRLRNFTPEAVAWFRFVEQDRGRDIADIGARLDMDRLTAACRRVAASGLAEEHHMATTDGKAEVMLRFAPYRSEMQTAGGVVFSVFDVSAVTHFARQAEAALADARASAEEVEAMYRGSPRGMGAVNRDLHVLRVNGTLADTIGSTADALVGSNIAAFLPGHAAQVAEAVAQVFDSGQPVLNQMLRGGTASDPDAARVWEVDWYPVLRADRVNAVGFNVTDVTDLLALQAELRRIMRELQHRVKNMLSNVIALVNRARRETGDPGLILDTLAQRIRALANTHSLLTTENWASTAIRDILRLELLNVFGTERVALRGPDIRLNARTTLAIGMAIHELATNAAKYGAFLTPEGSVTLRWARIDEGAGEELVLRWTETGGPPVAVPDRQGFGTQLIRSMIEGTLGGKVEADWEPRGLRVVVTLPWNAATEVDYDSDLDPLRHADPLP